VQVFQNRPPRLQTLAFSFGIERSIIDKLNDTGGDISEKVLIQTVKQAFELAHPEKEVAAHLPSLVETVIARINSLQTDHSPTPSKGYVSKSLGTRYVEWLSEMDAEEVCMYLAEYDVNRAERLYWYEDIPAVQKAVTLKSQHDNQMTLVYMEAALYGQGGKYKDDDGGQAVDYLSMSTEESSAALKQFGF
jgi:hypothetical protein